MKFRVLLTSLLLVSQLAFAQEKQTSEQLYQEAYENFVKRDYTAASASLDKINPVDQKKADILNLRGAIYKRLGELDNAANAYTDALKINPKDWVPKYNLAEVNFLREQYKPARTFLEQALASMPEADRLQKQDLILYKVYLTYLLQGDDEKAKLLLDSFDINSPNPVYYFAQAAWSYKKKDVAKAKTWVNSTDGLYSQDLRNSYSQALVDVGWLEPSEGGATSLTANAAPSATPTEVAVAASPTPAVPPPAAVVPLATNNATPIAVVEPSATPQPSVAASATPVASIPEPAVASDTKGSNGGFLAKIVAMVALLGVASVLLINLAKKSRIVPPPEDNIGYEAIAASGNPDTANAIAFSPEGTGVVLEQDENGEVPPAAIRVSPIHRDYAEAAAADAPTRKGRKTSTGKTASGGKPSPKAVLNAETKAPVSLKKTTSKPAPKVTPAVAKTPAAKTSKPAAKPEVAAKAPAKATTKSTGGKRVRLVAVPTIDVPPPEVPPAKLMVSNIEVLRVDPTKASAPVETKPAPKAKAKPAAKTKAAPKAPAPRPAASLITIPEFEDAGLESAPTTVIRLVPESAPKEDDSKNV